MYNYGFRDPIITKTNEFIYVKENRNLYMFYRLNENINNIEYTNNDVTYYKVIQNTNREYITFYKGYGYILLKVQNKTFIDSKEITYNSNFEINSDETVNWVELWEAKIDKIEEMIEKDNNNIIIETRDYYIGLGETAVQFILYNNDKIIPHGKCLCRKRIDDKIFRLPTNSVIDYKERDIAEYIKYLFFIKNKNSMEIVHYLRSFNIDKYDKILLYGRLLFPTYYFDLIDDYLDKNINIREDIERINKKAHEYELLLKELFTILFQNINHIEWIKKTKPSFV